MLENIFPCLKKPDITKEPERPAPEEALPKYEVPNIIDLPIDVQTQGKYQTKSGWARGLVVHYTAGRSLQGRSNAESALKHLAQSGLGCLVMDKDGVIYKARNQALNQVAWHAGQSAWKGETGVSRFCMGMEICNAGLLDKNLKSWFGETYPLEATREIKQKKDNHLVGHWLKFTPAQESSLINFCLWQLDTNPEFQLDWIVGHDEVCVPQLRKVDPGGSLSMTMPEFRAHLEKLHRG